MYFEIQVSNPAVRDRARVEREDLSSAIRAAFPEMTEDAILVWNWVPVRINYNADLSVMMEDLLVLIGKLLESGSGSHGASFGANTFRARWPVEWSGGMLRIESVWDSVAGSYEDLLNSRATLEWPVEEFLGEWKAPLRKVVDAIDRSGVRIAAVEEMTRLRQTEGAIGRSGRVYEPRPRDYG